MENFLNYFRPHPQTHQKAKLLSWHFLLIYILMFLLLRAGLDVVSVYKPGVLGVDSNITAQKIIEDTNRQRQQKGLSVLRGNASLETAAAAKAQNMFEENYWAHFSPSGKDPWGFILKSGYKFSYAGENLARNFYTADDVVKAWMNSPSHRDNILNPNYEDIGIAVLEGVLNGQKTTLVVQMFGKGYQPLASAPQVDLGGQKMFVSPQEVTKNQQVLIAGVKNTAVLPAADAALDPLWTMKIVGLFLISFIAFLLCLDLWILKKRGVFRLSSHHIAHLSFLTLSGVSLLLSQAGEIL